ncbi:MAG: apolipoprotein N-acyltransferase [Actinomycetota bacterium]
MRRWALAAVSGVGLGLAFPPFGLAPLVFVGPAGLLLAIAGARPIVRLVSGLLFGVAFFGLLLSWVGIFGLHAWLALVLAESTFGGLFAWAAGPMLGRPFAASFGISALWVLVMEVARGRFPLGGFPWGSLGAPLVGTPLDAAALLGGGILVAWLAAYLAALLTLAVRRRFRSVILGLVAVAGVVGLSVSLAPHPDAASMLRVALVQGDVPLPAGPSTRERTTDVLANHVSLTRTIPPGSVDVVVWPEDVVDLDTSAPSVGEPAPEPMRQLARDLHAWFLVGVVSDAGPGRFRNSALSVDPSGIVRGTYDKTRPVPFGEYVPWRRFLGFVTALRNVPRDMVPGRDTLPVQVAGAQVGTPISYEVVFSRIVRGFAQRGADAIVVLTNTSSYGPGAATADQQLQVTRMRAVELGEWVVQSAPSGISAVVDPEGRVVRRTGLFEPAIIRAAIGLERSAAPFARFGELPVIAFAIVAVAWALGSSIADMLRPIVDNHSR